MCVSGFQFPTCVLWASALKIWFFSIINQSIYFEPFSPYFSIQLYFYYISIFLFLQYATRHAMLLDRGVLSSGAPPRWSVYVRKAIEERTKLMGDSYVLVRTAVYLYFFYFFLFFPALHIFALFSFILLYYFWLLNC